MSDSTDRLSYKSVERRIIERSGPKLNSLQAGRGVAALMVVLCHIGAFVGGVPGLWHAEKLNLWLAPGGLGVDYFFILSGLVIFLAHRSDLGNPRRVLSFLWKRFRRIYPIYWVFLVPTVFKQFRVDNGYTFDQRNPWVILSSFILVHVKSLDVNMAVSWTLFHEILFYLFFSLLLISKRLGLLLVSGWLCGSLFVMLPNLFSVGLNNYFEMLFSPLHCLFAFGMVIGFLVEKGLAPTQRWIQALGGTIFVASACLSCALSVAFIWARPLGDVGLALFVLVASGRDRLRATPIPKLFMLLGDASYSIYLVHFMIISAIARKGVLLDQSLHLPIIAWCSLMFVVAVSSGIFSHLLIERPLLRLIPR